MKGKQFFKQSVRVAALLCGMALLGAATFPDEGMWTFDNPPTKQLQKKYNFTPTQEWLDHVRLASVRFMDGGSGSFVSANGLVMTNHHVARGQLQKLSTAENNLVEKGFYAATQDQELKSPDLEVNVLISMDNVTDRVQSVVKKDMSPEDALKAKQAEIAKIEKESQDKTGYRSDVINLYHGGEYWLYRYKKFTDVRLVFAPEVQAAYFGGDYDNFTYPRYDLDVSFFRVYENDKPVQWENFFKWKTAGAKEGELVFVSGNPGGSSRLYTNARLLFLRDYQVPFILDYIDKYVKILREYAAKGPEEARRAQGRIFGLENARKAYTGRYNGLMDDKIMALKKKQEQDFRQKVESNPEWQAEYGDAWSTIEQVLQKNVEYSKQQFFRRLRGSSLASRALTIVRYVEEIEKPNGERLEGYHDAQLDGLKFRLFSPAPVYKDMEEALLGGLLQLSLDHLGPNDPFIKTVLQGRTPEETAHALIGGTKLGDVAFRKTLVEGGQKAVQESEDPLIQLAREIDPMLREQREWVKKNIESVMDEASEKIAKARFAVYGKSTYPDATFTLRLSYGTVQGYPYNGTLAPYKTTLYGLYDRAHSFDQKQSWFLPQRFWDRIDKLDLTTPVNFVTTNDVIGGNSGSPVINQNAEVVGLVFDGNIESLPGDYIYDIEKNRTVSVHTAYIIEALRKLYDAPALADELEQGAPGTN